MNGPFLAEIRPRACSREKDLFSLWLEHGDADAADGAGFDDLNLRCSGAARSRAAAPGDEEASCVYDILCRGDSEDEVG